MLTSSVGRYKNGGKKAVSYARLSVTIYQRLLLHTNMMVGMGSATLANHSKHDTWLVHVAQTDILPSLLESLAMNHPRTGVTALVPFWLHFPMKPPTMSNWSPFDWHVTWTRVKPEGKSCVLIDGNSGILGHWSALFTGATDHWKLSFLQSFNRCLFCWYRPFVPCVI